MDKKTIATSITGIFVLVFIIAIGATLSAFKVEKQKVEVKSIIVEAEQGIKVSDKNGEEISKLKIKSSGVGVRPATGEEDNHTQVPSTINDNIGTEGAYACFYLTAQSDCVIKLLSCELTAGQEDNLDNVRIAVLDDKSEALKGSQLGNVLAEVQSGSNKKITVVVWLDADTKKTIASADINIVLSIVYKQ